MSINSRMCADLGGRPIDDIRVGQAFPGGEGVFDVVFKTVIRPQDRGDSPWAILVEVSVRPRLVTRLTRANSATFKA